MKVNFNTSVSSVSSSQKTPADIMSKLLSMGVTPTGNYDADIKLLSTAQAKSGDKTDKSAQKSSSLAPPKEALPWADLLSKLGLSPQGSKEADFAAITSKISQLEASAKTDSEKANVSGLKSELQTAISASANLSPPSVPQTNFIGLNQLSQMNQMFHGLNQ